MRAPARVLVLAVVALTLLSGCGDDDDSAHGHATSPASPTAKSRSTDQAVADPVAVNLYDADFEVSASGDLTVVETLTLDVSVGGRHGIVRTFGSDLEVADFAATLDGRPTPIKDLGENTDKGFRVGSPTRTLDVGEHVVRMQYRVPDVLTGSGAGSKEFRWTLIQSGWTMRIRASRLSVHLPAEGKEADCRIGTTQPCNLTGVGTKTVVVHTGEVPNHTAVRLRVLMSRPDSKTTAGGGASNIRGQHRPSCRRLSLVTVLGVPMTLHANAPWTGRPGLLKVRHSAASA